MVGSTVHEVFAAGVFGGVGGIDAKDLVSIDEFVKFLRNLDVIHMDSRVNPQHRRVSHFSKKNKVVLVQYIYKVL